VFYLVLTAGIFALIGAVLKMVEGL